MPSIPLQQSTISTGKRLVILTILGVTALSIVGIVGIVSLNEVKGVVSSITIQTIPKIEASYRLGATYRDLRLLLLSHINENDSFIKDAFAEKIQELENYGNTILEQYKLLASNHKAQKELLSAYHEYINIHHIALQYSKQNKIDLAKSELYGEAFPATQKMERLLIQSAEENRQDEKEANLRIERTYKNAIYTFSFGIFGTAITFMILGWLLIRERSLSEKFEHHTKTDALTNLGNRYYFNEASTLMLQQAQLQNINFSILFMDLNGFKAINDTFGHDVGDSVLKIVSSRLTESLRECDIIARLGGDEFVMLIQTKAAGATLVAQKAIDAIQVPMEINQHSHCIFASIGIANYPTHGNTIDILIKKADAAMYSAKKEAKRQKCGFYITWSEEILLESQTTPQH